MCRNLRECVNSENVGQVEELLLMTEQMQDELDQKDQTILELNRQLSESLTLNEKLNSENRAENIEALRTRLRQTEQQLTSETDSRKRADAEVVAWKFKYEKAEQAKRYAQTHQKIVIYFGEWIKSIIPINLIALLLLVHVIYIGIRCYVKDWREERGYY